MEEKNVSTNLKKNKEGYGYKYTELAEIHRYLEENNMSYYQYTERIEKDDYIMTVKIINGEEKPPLRGCRVVDATLQGIKNPAQEQGSALTYARRYSLLMAFGLATEDDDAQSLTKPNEEIKTLEEAENYTITFGKYNGKTLKEIWNDDISYIDWLDKKGDDTVKSCIKILDNNYEDLKEYRGIDDMYDNLSKDSDELPF